MLLFIEYQLESGKYLPKFQNIVCYCLSLKSKLNLFTFKGFQNIVCYCLSTAGSTNVFPFDDFKTSYVTVYQWGDLRPNIPNVFQNIVCYCLSFPNIDRKINSQISKHRMLLFIAVKHVRLWTNTGNFKTSYVTVYRIDALENDR